MKLAWAALPLRPHVSRTSAEAPGTRRPGPSMQLEAPDARQAALAIAAEASPPVLRLADRSRTLAFACARSPTQDEAFARAPRPVPEGMRNGHLAGELALLPRGSAPPSPTSSLRPSCLACRTRCNQRWAPFKYPQVRGSAADRAPGLGTWIPDADLGCRLNQVILQRDRPWSPHR